MPSLDYSSDAINILNRFHNCDVMVYVEGDDDVLFWDFLFKNISDVNVKVESVGGSIEIDKIIEKILSSEISVVAARDSDYKGILNEKVVHSNVLYTYGYSIENTMLTAKALKNITRISCRDNTLTEQDCTVWMDGFASELYELVCADIVNYKDNLSMCVLGDNCERFMVSKKSHIIDDGKISSHLSNVCQSIPNNRLEYIDSIFVTNGYVLLDFIKGHFIFSAVIKFMKNKAKEFGRSVSVSNEQLYGNIFLAFQSVFNSSHPHYDFYFNEIRAIEI